MSGIDPSPSLPLLPLSTTHTNTQTTNTPARTLTGGTVESFPISHHLFELQRRQFTNTNTGILPSQLDTAHDSTIHNTQKFSANPNAQTPREREARGNPANENYKGPWAADVAEKEEKEKEREMNSEERANEIEAIKKIEERKKEMGKAKAAGFKDKSIFHGQALYDYQGRSYVHVPQDQGIDLKRDPGDHACYIPSKIVHTWTGHTKGVNAIRFFPRAGHLLLSASNDEKVKIWDVYNDRRCLRTYIGHEKAVRDICFSNDGRKFLSASYDKYIKLWDTETGQCIRAFTNDRVPYCAKFNPDEDKQNIFLAGCADKKVIQYDINSGEVVQQYDEHLGPVNTITFVDENRRFVTTSDDKTMRVWEYGIPVCIKYIAEPHMHSMPSVALHPNKKWIACQSLDNQILVYTARDRFKLHRNKRFAGHQTAGYACQTSFSPDGQFVASGESSGQVVFWNWQTCRLIKKLPGHQKVVVGVEWHPQEPSKVATCSWDNNINFYD